MPPASFPSDKITPKLFSGIDNLSLDTRTFDPSRDDIKGICRFFSLGKLQYYEKEKGIIVSHANFFVFVETTRGQYALKFYPTDAAKPIAIEYAINKILINHHLPTPLMHAGPDGQPFLASNDRLATCYSYIDGTPAWQQIKQRNTFPKINAVLFSLKNILSTDLKHIPFLKQENLATTMNTLTQASRTWAGYDQKDIIDASLLDACQTYHDHQPLFTRQYLHNNAHLNNFLIHKNFVYILDLTHLREDYVLSDLTSLVTSCLFFNVPFTTIKTMVKNYFTQHKIGPDLMPLLNTLIKVGLIKEYLKNIKREKSVKISNYPAGLMQTYLSHLSGRKELITAVLRKTPFIGASANLVK